MLQLKHYNLLYNSKGEYMQHILIIEDDIALGNGLVRALSNENCTAVCVENLSMARKSLAQKCFSLIVLDVNLPDGNGLDFLKEIKNTCSIPVVMLTANDLESDIVSGLELGADDYITKPFSLAILRARINARLRKFSTKISNKFIHDKFVFDFERMEFTVENTNVELSKTEQKLLRYLTENNGITLSREKLVDRIWTDNAEYVDENALSVTVNRLRNKLGAKEYIKTVHGIGYVWVKKDD